MKIYEQANKLLLKRAFIAASVVISGLCWYFSNGLSGSLWYVLWFAPVPILLISLNATTKATFFISFIAYLIGRLSWFTYLVTVATLIPAIIFTVALPIVFALIMIVTRSTVIKINSWYAVFAFPVFFTTFEAVLIQFSPDGTAASIAYSQSDFLPIVQIASVTGILGITFIVTLIPSALAVGWHYRKEKNKLARLAIAAFIPIISVLLFGMIRINSHSEKPATIVGLAVLGEKTHKMGSNINLEEELQHINNYAYEISKFAALGARVVVLPERAININNEMDAAAIGILSSVAKQHHVAIITGYTNFKNDRERNSALVIDTAGNVVMDYNKVYLVKGLESQFTPGNEIGMFGLNGVQAGTAICKDLDFPNYIKKYGASEATVVYIPAWDFVVDDWLHSRMAVLRGVENGFSEVRAARQGRLSISDYYGKITSERSCANGQPVSMIGAVPLDKKRTLYTRFGNWFGIINIVTAIFFLLIPAVKRNTV